jgi:molecular chaperone Hsp33
MTQPDDKECAEVSCRFVREHNALLCAGDFGAVFVDFYLHLGQNGLVLANGTDEQLKLLLVAVTLHAATRPHAETWAWTLHLDEQKLNFFALAENPTGHVVGQLFPENVRTTGGDTLHVEMATADGQRRRSVVDLQGHEGILSVAEAYYRQSEQRPARFFDLGGDAFAIVAAQPDCDLEWLEKVGADEIAQRWHDPAQKSLETRFYKFCCGCTPERISAAIGPALSANLEEVFQGESMIRVTCPRCGAKHEIPKSLFDNKSPDGLP